MSVTHTTESVETIKYDPLQVYEYGQSLYQVPDTNTSCGFQITNDGHREGAIHIGWVETAPTYENGYVLTIEPAHG